MVVAQSWNDYLGIKRLWGLIPVGVGLFFFFSLSLIYEFLTGLSTIPSDGNLIDATTFISWFLTALVGED